MSRLRTRYNDSIFDDALAMRSFGYRLSSCLLAAFLVGCQSVPAPPAQVRKPDLLDGLWALSTQDRAITVEDVLEKLNLNADDLDRVVPDDASRLIYGWETYIHWKDVKTIDSHPIRAIEITRILAPESYAKPDEQFSHQVVWIFLNEKAACSISTETVSARLRMTYDTEYFPGFADVTPGTFYYFRYHGAKTAGYLSVRPKCSSRIEIRKLFVPPQKRASAVPAPSARQGTPSTPPG